MKPEILTDMDGVIADQMSRVFEIIEQEDGISLCHYDVQDYWFKDMAVEPGRIIDIFRRDGFYRELNVVTGAVHAINRLRRDFDVRVCSQPMKGAANCEGEKRSWLAHHFDQEFADSAIITNDKTSVPGDVLIEDNPDIARNAAWKAIIFDQPWNRNVTDLDVMHGWGDIGVVYAAV